MALSASKLEGKIKPSIKTAFERITLINIVQANFKKIQGNRVVDNEDAFNTSQRKAIALAETIADAFAKDLAKEIVSHIKTADVTCTILPGTINVVGSPSAQVGPPAPLNISGQVK